MHHTFIKKIQQEIKKIDKYKYFYNNNNNNNNHNNNLGHRIKMKGEDEDKSEEKQDNYECLLPEQNHEHNIQQDRKYSTFLSQYQNIRKIYGTKNIEQYCQELKNNNIFYNPKTFQDNPQFTILSHSNQYRVFRLAVSFSFFTVELKILNSDRQSCLKQNLPMIGFGAYSQVFKVETLQNNNCQKFALKSVFSQSQQISVTKVNQNLNLAIFQYSLYKLFSILQIGPHMPNFFGFDLYIYEDAIQFAMELCSKPRLNQAHNLMKDLLTVHSLKIIHGDIKPQNIMWSQKYQKNVFVDFGLSRLVVQEIGELSFTYFFGTYGFCCNEMKNLFYLNKFDYVDLYYNDIFALQKSLGLIFDGRITKNETDGPLITNEFLNKLLNFKLINLIFQKDVQSIQRFVNEFPNLDLLPETFSFFHEVNWSKSVARIIVILTNSYYFPPKERQSLILFSKLKSFKLASKKGKSRVLSLTKQSKGSINEIMFFLLYFYKQDITPKALKASELLKQQLYKFEGKQEDWQNLIKYSMNPYVDTQDLEQIYGHIKEKIKISQWEEGNVKQLKVFMKSKQIADIAMSNFGINLYQMKDKLQQQYYYQNSLQNQAQTSLLVQQLLELKKELKQNLNSGVELSWSNLNTKTKKNVSKYSSRIIDLILKAEDIESKDQKQFDKVQIFLQNFPFSKAAFKTRSIAHYRLMVLSQFFFQLSMDQLFSLQVNFFSKLNVYAFDLQKCTQICAYDQIYFHLIQPFTNIPVFRQKIQSIVHLNLKLKAKSAFISSFSIFYKALQMVFNKVKLELVIEYSKIIFEACKVLLNAVNYKLSKQYYAFVVTILTSLPFGPKSECQQFALLVLDSAKQYSKGMTPYDWYGYALDKIGICLKYQLFSRQDCAQQLRGYLSLLRKQKDQSLKCSEYEYGYRMYSSFLFLAFQCGLNPQEQALDFINLAFKNIKCFDNYPQYVYVITLYFSKKPVSYFSQYFDFVLKIIEYVPKYSQKKEQNYYIWTCLDILVFRYLLNKKQHFTSLKQLFYNEIIKNFTQKPERFCIDYSNILITLVILIKMSFLEKSPFEKEIIEGMLKIASLMIEHCIFQIKRLFINSMTVWSLDFVNNFIIDASQRKALILKLKYLRNCQFMSQTREIEQFFLSKLFRKKISRVYNGLMCKFHNLRNNKFQVVNFDPFFSNLRGGYAHRQFLLLNTKTPNVNMLKLFESYFFTAVTKNNVEDFYQNKNLSDYID